MIRTLNLSRVFRTDEVETTALNRIDFEVKAGEFVAIMGPSGCGKSTLLNILGLLDSPSDGEYFFNGIDVSGFDEKRRTDTRRGKIGFIFQNFNLIDSLNVQENVELPLYYLNIRPSQRRQQVREILERMKISHRRNHFPQQLSGGQQQRVAIARAVVTNPSLILADEPTGNLDSGHGEEVLRLLEELNVAGTTIVMVTHSPAHADRAHHIVYLLDGSIVTIINHVFAQINISKSLQTHRLHICEPWWIDCRHYLHFSYRDFYNP
jgi:putative ABC transport system ATP-binding protein